MTVRAKMICTSKVVDPLGNALVVVEASRPEANDSLENRTFAEATPAATLSMQISRGKKAADQIEQGGVYYVDLTPAEAYQRWRQGIHPEYRRVPVQAFGEIAR